MMQSMGMLRFEEMRSFRSLTVAVSLISSLSKPSLHQAKAFSPGTLWKASHKSLLEILYSNSAEACMSVPADACAILLTI